MNTFLLTWNPSRWDWASLSNDVEKLYKNGFLDDTWSCGRIKKIHSGDRFFLLRQGNNHPGIVASGWTTSDTYLDSHWDGTRSDETRYVKVRFDALLNPESESIFERDRLFTSKLTSTIWNTQMSGVTIPPEVAQILEEEWASFLVSEKFFQKNAPQYYVQTGEEQSINQQYEEGSIYTITVNAYERNALARQYCIQHYGLSCVVCNFNFAERYGDRGIGYIHVHHLIPLSTIGREYKLDPITDMRPICPNCHTMIHRHDPLLSIEELQDMLLNNHQ